MPDKNSSRKPLWLALAAAGIIGVVALAAALILGSPSPRDAEPETDGSSKQATRTATPSVPETLSAAAAAVPPGGIVTLDAGEKTGKFMLRIFFWNDTEKRPLKEPVIEWGSSGSWRVDPSMAAEQAIIGPFRTGTKLTLTVYPDGAGGKGHSVPFVLGSKMLSGSERDGMHVEIRDGQVHVLGNAVDNFDRTYTRP